MNKVWIIGSSKYVPCMPYLMDEEYATFYKVETFETRIEAKNAYIVAEQKRINELAKFLDDYKIERKYPSDFLRHPYNSILKDLKYEKIARNIITILARTCDTWRDLSWEEYVKERQKDEDELSLILTEKGYFDIVTPFCKTVELAKLFCPTW